MTPEQIERNRQFLRDLRANPRKAKGKMHDREGGRCCLCVALNTAVSLGLELRDPIEMYTSLPPRNMGAFYGWGVSNPHLGVNRLKAAQHNDGKGTPELSHPEIADLFEETFPELKLP